MELILIFSAMFLTLMTLSAGVMMMLAERQPALASGEIEAAPRREKFAERVLFPVAEKLAYSLRRVWPTGQDSWTRQKLVQAGYSKPHFPAVVFGLQVLSALAGFLGGAFLFLNVFKLGWSAGVILSCFYALAGYALPLVWVQQQATVRQRNLNRSLPDFLDLLVISVEAGLGLDIAIQKIASLDLGKQAVPLKEEWSVYLKDVYLGKPRKQALMDLASRNAVEDLSMLVHALTQTYEMGNSVAHTLRVQSEMMRSKRLQLAEERANKVAVKMVMPIYIFLFPAIFVTIFGPVGMVLIKTMGQIFTQSETLR